MTAAVQGGHASTPAASAGSLPPIRTDRELAEDKSSLTQKDVKCFVETFNGTAYTLSIEQECKVMLCEVKLALPLLQRQ